MARYLTGRILQALLVLWIAYTATFFLLSVLPGDGIMIKFENPDMGLSAAEIQAIRDYYRVDDPVLLQYVHALIGTVQGDFGFSIQNAVPVRERLAVALPQTIALAVPAFLLAIVLAGVFAVLASFARFAWLRRAIQAIPSVFVSVPVFWLGLVLIQVFSFQLCWVPMIGASPLQALILPVITLAIPVSAPLAQLFLRSLDEVRSRPFVLVVQAKGASKWWSLSRHTAKNALLPTLTMGGLIFAELIAGSVIVETVFGRTGIGRLMTDAVASQDLPVIQAVVIIAATVFVTVNLVIDLLYPVLDPRLRGIWQRSRSSRPSIALTPEAAHGR
jgi:peptide/nickel transport system permease protein